ncbi:MAG: methyltransferase domain-containing protein [Anaerolineales bacterium]|nr:methyltransferase domain-containing protein [Anaerolineales bacterium]MCZ2121316.1 methyltransferase domain-containing protein [Anaerolineales bacterium]
MDILIETGATPAESKTAQLDATQYTRESILKYEKIFGKNFVSTGGAESTREIIAMLNLKPGMKVLDIGSGLGGSAFMMAQEYGAQVHGLDLSHNMLDIAQERLHELNLEKQVSFEYGDFLESQIDAQYDVVYSRDAFLHIHDKAKLFQVIFKTLKPNGLLFFTDYCWGEGEHSEEFLAYVAQRGYAMYTPKEYGEFIKAAGFKDVQALDKTKLFGDYLRLELEKLPKDNSIPEIRQSWNEKILRNQRGEQGWGWFMGKK